MTRLTILLLCIGSMLMANAEKYSYKFNSTSLSDALAKISEDHPEAKISFIFNELEKYNTSSKVSSDDPYMALRQAIGINPVTVVRDGNGLYCEALQHGRFRLSGQAVGSDYRPVADATVMVLAPKDSTVITYGTTDANGRFSIPVDKKNVIVKLSSIGYEPTYKRCADNDAGTIMMKEHTVRLQEVKVEAKDAFAYSDKSVFIPSARQKKFSTGATDLLSHMSIPQIMVNPQNGSVSDITGVPVTIFINYVKMGDGENEGLLTKDVMRVEYLENPSDSRFLGESRVLNFIVKEYEYGGYTKLSAVEKVLSQPLTMAGVFSKFVYKKFTYDIFTGYNHGHDNDSYSKMTSSYNLKDADGNKYTVSRDLNTDKIHSSDNNFPVSMRAKYISGNFMMTHSASYNHTRNKSDREGGLSIIDKTITKNPFSSNYDNMMNLATYTGQFYWSLPNNYSLNINPNFSYRHINNMMKYDGGSSDIINRLAKENDFSYSIKTMLDKRFGVHYIGLNLDYFHDIDNIDYYGTSSFTSKFNALTATGKISYRLNLKGWSLYSHLGLAYQHHKIDNNSISETYPYFYASLFRSLNGSQSFGITYQYANFSPELFEKTPGVLKDNEYMYISGNPDLRNSKLNQVQFSYNNFKYNFMKGSVFVDYQLFKDNISQIYDYYLDGSAIVRNYANAGDFSQSRLGANLSSKLSRGKIVLQASPTLYYYHATGQYKIHQFSFKVFGSMTFYFKNFYVQPSVSSIDRSISRTNHAKIEQTWKYTLSMGANFGNWNLKVSFNDLLDKRKKLSQTELVTPLYSYSLYNYGKMGNIRIMATYSFSYGKKTKDRNEIGANEDTSSSILK